MMPKEYVIFPNPTVKEVIFLIKFSHLFIIENKIGDFQSLIVERFPESSLSIRRNLLFVDTGPQFNLDEIPSEEFAVRKVWQFKSKNEYVLNLTTDSLSITSVRHKSYYDINEGFREIIKFALEKFLSIIPLKTISRMGLRYIDDSPLPDLDNDKFSEWYNTSFPLHRFKIPETVSMQFVATVKKDDNFLIYREEYLPQKNNLILRLDFDSYALNIKAEEYLEKLDQLYIIIHNEWYNNTIKEPVKAFMSKKV